jgi:CBS domain-containing protein
MVEDLETPVSEVMSTPLRTVAPEMTVGTAATVLRQEGIGSLVVTRSGGDTIAGIVTESDIVRSVGADYDTDRMTVDRLMTEDVVAVGPEATLQTACNRMTDHDVERLPVVTGAGPVGIVTTTDLAHALARGLDDVLAAFA